MLSAAAVGYFLMPPYHSTIVNGEQIAILVLFILIMAVSFWFLDRQRRAAQWSIALHRRLLEKANEAIAIADAEFKLLYWNRGAAKLYGWTSAEVIGKDVRSLLHPKYSEPRERISEKLQANGYWHGRLACINRGGEEVVSESSWTLDRETGFILYTNLDVSARMGVENQLTRVMRVLNALSRVNDALIEARDGYELNRLFSDVCRIAVEDGLCSMAWVGFVDPLTLWVNPVAKWGKDDGYLDEIRTSAADIPEGCGAVGTAIREGHSFAANDIERDPQVALWREAAIKRGFRSVAALPLKVAGRSVGALALYSSEVGFFTDENVPLLERAAYNLSNAIERAGLVEERERAEAALQASEERYRKIVQNSPDLIYVEHDGYITFINSAGVKLLHAKSESEILGSSIFRFIHPDSHAMVKERIAQLRKAPCVFPFANHKYLAVDGTELDLEVIATSFRSGEHLDVQVVARDITERNRLHEEMQFQNALLTAQQETSMDGILVVDESNHILSLNRRFAEIWQVPPELIEARDDAKVLQHAMNQVVDPESFTARIRYLYAHPKETSQDEVLLKDGRVLERYSASMHGSSGRCYGRIWYFHDATQRRQAEESLRIREEVFSSIVNQAMDSIALLDAETGCFVEFNEAAHHDLGYTREEFANFGVGDIQAEYSQDDIRRNIEHIRVHGSAGFETVHRHRNGSLRAVHVRARQLTLRNKQYITAVWTDITERKASEQQLQRLNRLYLALGRINEAIVRETDRLELMQQVCRILVEVGGFDMAWVGTPTPAGLMEVRAQFGDTSGYLEGIHIAVDDRFEGLGPTGTAFREGRTVVCNDLQSNLAYGPWRDRAEQVGLRASLALPLRQGGAVIGSLSIYSKEKDFFGAREIELAEEAASDLLFAFDVLAKDEQRRSAQEALQASEGRLRMLVSATPAIIYTCRPSDFSTTFVSENVTPILGHRPEDFIDDPKFWAKNLHPDDSVTTFSAGDRLSLDAPLVREYRFRHSDGSYRWLRDELRVVPDDHGMPMMYAGCLVDITEARQSTAQIRQLSRVVEEMDDTVMITDVDGVIRYVNPAFERHLGYAHEEVLGKTPRILKSGLESPEFYRDLWRTILRGKPFQAEFHNRCKDGWIIVEAKTITPIRDERGILSGFVSTGKDITERKQAEAELATTQRQIQLILQSVGEGIYGLSVDGKVTFLNAAAVATLGWNEQELRGTEIHPLIHHHSSGGGEYPTEECPIRKTLLDGQTRTVTNEVFFRKDGSQFPVEYVCTPIFDDSGVISGGVVSFMDVTHKRVAEGKLREQAALLEKARDAIVVRDLDHRILYWNKSAERLYGWTSEETVGRSAVDMFYSDSTIYNAAFRATIEKDEWVGELEQRTKGGELITVEGHWSLVRDDAGVPKSILAINTDLTQRKKLEQQYLRAQRMEGIGTLASGIAHDLNNVLAPIMMSADLLKMDERDEKRLKRLNNIMAGVKRGAELIRQVLSFARGIEGKRVDVQIRHLIGDVEKIISETFPKDILVETDVSRNLWTVQADSTQIHQVLLNLCVNARDAMPDGGRLTITAGNVQIDEHYAAMNIESEVGPYVVIRVEDTGTGIPNDIVNQIFDPFFTTKELGKGTGLGLATTMTIVKSHGGFIHVYTEVGKGTSFRVYLPAQPSNSAQPVADSAADMPRGDGETVLVVDDEAMIRQVTQQTLEFYGYNVLVASDGAEALALYAQKKNQIAVVLTDMMMPVMDGRSMIQALRQMNPLVHVIGTSGMGNTGKSVRDSDLNEENFLTKPYRAELLLKMLRRMLHENP
jgi:PAS domain S-box-containing protein